MIIDSHWKRLSSIDFAYTVPLEPPYMNCKANYLTTNRQITNTTNTNIANTLHSTSGAKMQKGNQRWLGQVYLQTGTEDSTAYAWPSQTLISKKKIMKFVYRDTWALWIKHCKKLPFSCQIIIYDFTPNKQLPLCNLPFPSRTSTKHPHPLASNSNNYKNLVTRD